MKNLLSRALACAAFVGLIVPFAAEAYDKMYVFGDSLSDSGNAFHLVPPPAFPPPPNNQRNSNGLVAVEYLAQQLGVALLPSTTAGGTNYAVSGAMTGQRTSVYPLPPSPGGVVVTTENYADPVYNSLFNTQVLRTGTSLLSQVTQFALSSPSFAPSSSLFVVWAGANDFFFDPQASTVVTSVTNIANSIGALVASGARQFLVPGLPDLSLTPAIRDLDASFPGAGIGAGYQALSLGFNQALLATLPALEGLAPGVDITYFDTSAALLGVIADPAALGLTNVSDACLVWGPQGIASLCAKPDEYLFWDQVHPSDRVAMELGRQFAVAVPEPESLTMLALGLILLTTSRLRLRARA